MNEPKPARLNTTLTQRAFDLMDEERLRRRAHRGDIGNIISEALVLLLDRERVVVVPSDLARTVIARLRELGEDGLANELEAALPIA